MVSTLFCDTALEGWPFDVCHCIFILFISSCFLRNPHIYTQQVIICLLNAEPNKYSPSEFRCQSEFVMGHSVIEKTREVGNLVHHSSSMENADHNVLLNELIMYSNRQLVSKQWN